MIRLGLRPKRAFKYFPPTMLVSRPHMKCIWSIAASHLGIWASARLTSFRGSSDPEVSAKESNDINVATCEVTTLPVTGVGSRVCHNQCVLSVSHVHQDRGPSYSDLNIKSAAVDLAS